MNPALHRKVHSDDGKALLTKFFGKVIDATDVAVKSLQKAGTPDAAGKRSAACVAL